jgi:CDP-diglyceride synthetase
VPIGSSTSPVTISHNFGNPPYQNATIPYLNVGVPSILGVWWIPWLLIILATVLSAIGGYWYGKRKKKEPVVKP